MKFATPTAIFLLVLVIHGLSPVDTVRDSRWSLPVAMSLIKEGNISLDEYAASIPPNDYCICSRGGHPYNVYPVGPSLCAVPFVCLADWGLKAIGVDLNALLKQKAIARLEVAIASFLVALAAVVLYLLALDVTRDRQAALVAALIFAFGTAAWSTATRALWSHAPSLLFLSLALWLSYRARVRPGLIVAVAGLLVVSYMMRPSNALALIVFTGFVWIAHRGWFARYSLALVGGLALFGALNRWTYGAWLPDYYLSHTFLSQSPVAALVGLAGTLVSPGRGLLVYSPVLACAGYACWLRRRQGAFTALEGAGGLLVLAHWVMISIWHNWWGGGSYGPRLFTDMLPFLLFLMLPALPGLLHPQDRAGRVWRGVFVALAVLSLAMNVPGAVSWGTVDWNLNPVNVDTAPWRLWDWSDPQFMRW